MSRLNKADIFKISKLTTWLKFSLFIIPTIALAAPLFLVAEDVLPAAESYAVSGDPNAAPAEKVPVFTSRAAVSEQSDDGQSAVILPEVKVGESVPGGDVGDAVVDQPSGILPIWERLDALDAKDKANAIIELEADTGVSASDSADFASAQSLWNSGAFDQAVTAIRALEESGATVAVGVSWKIPKAPIQANWMDGDIRIGARTQISETHLDYDAQTGNQFAVLRFRDGSTTEWYWSVNYSADGGETWTETYSWFANFEIKDTAAAVVDDYLWVGYVHNTTFDDARIRRFFVSDGAVDFFYGFQTVFNKGVAIKEIALNANADDYDNRLYYWAILDQSSPVTVAVEQTPADVVHKDYPNVSSGAIQMGTTEEMLAQLEVSPKLYSPETILDDFQAGYTMTRVIVDLRDPDVTMATRAVRSDFQDLAVQQVVAQQVNAAQTNVIDAMDANEVNITNQFDYIFSFSAEVTVAGLAALANHPDVVFIKEDGILEPHLAQGIPLMNGTTARSTYNGSGMSIAICDTGIDYTHSRLGGGGFPNTKVIGGYDTGQNDTDPMDGNGHGTACAGIAAGDLGTVGDYIGGVAYNARLYALKISYSSTGGSAYESDFVEAVEWCITHQNDDPSNPIMVISTSFGGYYYNNQASCDAYWPSMTTAVANAKSAGMTLFYSTGNDGFTDGTGWPGCLSDVVGVGAVYDANIGSYSGSCYDATTAADQVTCYSSSASFMSLFAPSHDAYTTAVGGGYRTDFGGTSAACPYAAGSGAVLQSAAMANSGAYLTPDQVQSTLENTGDPITDPKAPTITKPRVNLGNAVEAIAIDNLIFYYGSGLATTTPSWTESPTGVSNASFGLDSTWNEGFSSGAGYFLYTSYIASDNGDNPVMVLRIDGSTVDVTQVLSDYTGTLASGTSISAYSDTVICAYENSFTNGLGIRYSVSYDGGGSWGAGTFQPDVGQNFYNPAVTLRGGQGSAMVHDEEAGTFDPVWFRYRDHYSSGAWDAEVAQINNNDTATAFPNTIEFLPPAGGTYAYGAIYLDGSLIPYFDRSDIADHSYGFLPSIYMLLLGQ